MTESILRSGRHAASASCAFAVIGLAISIYLTIEHFSASTTFACPESSTINCVRVTTSQWSRFAGLPVAVLGLAYFIGMTVLCVPWLWRYRPLDLLRVAGIAAGGISVLYLLWAELFRVGAICLWCTGVHLCTVALIACVLWATSEIRAAAAST